MDGALAACLCPALAAPLVLLSAYSVSLLRSEYPQGGPTPEAFGLFAVLIGWLAHSVGLVAAFGANRSDPARDGWLEWIPWMEVGLVVATIVAMSFAMEIFEGFLGKWSAAAAVALLAWSGLLGAYYGVRGYLAWRRACRIRE
ncbi:MAG: hypothetical protein SF028_14375 [Candidatus Sumerlaeia bacterium]|nr:hypothetical protein [Candidatus Sumerlaeia bacterium]